MRQRRFEIALGAVGLCCILLALVRASLAGVFSAAAAFPFEQIGLGLRAISLSGGVGNGLALALYLLLSLLPLGAMLLLGWRRGLKPEDGLLALGTPVLLVVLYRMVNPALLSTYNGAVGKAVLGIMVYALLCAWLVLRVLRRAFAAEGDVLQRYLAVLLRVMAVFFVAAACGICLGGLLDSIAALRAGNVGTETGLGLTYLFLVLQYVVDALPYLLDVAVVLAALRLLAARRADPYSEGAVAAGRALARRCGMALTVTVLLQVAFNLLQLCFLTRLRVVNSTAQLPVFSVGFVLAVLLLSQLMGVTKRLKDDNDMFI